MNFENFMNSQLRLIKESDLKMEDVLGKNREQQEEETTDKEETQEKESSTPNLILCDIDGVIIDKGYHKSGEYGIQYNKESEKALEVLKQICDETNAKVAINSTWSWWDFKGVSESDKAQVAGAENKQRSPIPGVMKKLKSLGILFEDPVVMPYKELPGFDNIVWEGGHPVGVKMMRKGEPVIDKETGKQKISGFYPIILKPFLMDNFLRKNSGKYNAYMILNDPPSPDHSDKFHAWNWACKSVSSDIISHTYLVEKALNVGDLNGSDAIEDYGMEATEGILNFFKRIISKS